MLREKNITILELHVLQNCSSKVKVTAFARQIEIEGICC